MMRHFLSLVCIFVLTVSSVVAFAFPSFFVFPYRHRRHRHIHHLTYASIGFDVRGDVKIFDFGLAKEVDPKKALPDGTYKLTGDTGSPRYMANEGTY